MRRGVLLMMRDYRVLMHLSFGPSGRASVFKNFFSKTNSNQKTRERVMTRRLEKLEEGGLVRSIIASMFKEPLYALTVKAAPIVASKFGLELSNIWVSYNDNHVEHDHYVASTARKIIKDAEVGKLYELSDLVLECYLKKNKKIEKGDYFPDIQFEIVGPERPLTFNLEGDCGTVSRKDFLGKMSFFKDNILVLVKTKERLDLLMWYLENSNVRKPVFCALFEDFFKSNLLDCKWHLPFSDRRITLRERFFSS